MVSEIVLAEVQDQTLGLLKKFGGIGRVYKKADYDFSPWQRIKSTVLQIIKVTFAKSEACSPHSQCDF